LKALCGFHRFLSVFGQFHKDFRHEGRGCCCACSGLF